MPLVIPDVPEPNLPGILDSAGVNAYPEKLTLQNVGAGHLDVACLVTGRYFVRCEYTMGGVGGLALTGNSV